MPGPIVLETVIDFIYVPLAPAGLASVTALMNVFKFASLLIKYYNFQTTFNSKFKF